MLTLLFLLTGIILALVIPPPGAAEEDYLLMGSNTARRVWITSSSDYHPDFRAVMALDGDRSSAWISSELQGPHWLSVNFGDKRLMTSLVVYPGRKDGRWTFRRFILQFFHDGAWFDFAVVPVRSGISFHRRVEVDLGGVDASLFRILVPADATVAGSAAIAEIEIFTGSSKVAFFDERLAGLCLPIRNAYLPADPSGYPNAPRAYRGGRHAGIDLYHFHRDRSYDSVPVDVTTRVRAAADGVVIRADHDYTPTDLGDWERRAAYYRSRPATFMARSFGGREIWIDHRNGVVTVYNHLSRIARSVKRGSRVSRGEHIGLAGNSGLADEAAGSGAGVHLHFEIWIDGNYLGYGMPFADIRKYLNWIFFQKQ